MKYNFIKITKLLFNVLRNRGFQNFLNLKLKKNTNIIFFWYGSSTQLVLKKVLIKYKKWFKYNNFFFFIIPDNDVPKKLKFIKLVLNNKDFTRN